MNSQWKREEVPCSANPRPGSPGSQQLISNSTAPHEAGPAVQKQVRRVFWASLASGPAAGSAVSDPLSEASQSRLPSSPHRTPGRPHRQDGRCSAGGRRSMARAAPGLALHAVLSLALLLGAVTPAAAATDNKLLCTPASLAICRPVELPDGFYTLPCTTEPSAVCGVAINTTRRSPCSQQQAAAVAATAATCGCISRLQQALSVARRDAALLQGESARLQLRGQSRCQ